MTNIEKTTFWSFLTNFSICIPIIQRDYAQGRTGKEELRKRFITSLRESISERRPLPLDFTYGKFSGAGENKTFYPLDGQQRLTTLWLLHWYVAYKAEKLQDAKTILQKFSYATRVSARDFCKRLCELPSLPEGCSDILMHIQNQNWFYSSWNQDPTIQSMLRMISDTDKRTGIVELLELTNYKASWKWLTQDCKMEFRILDIVEIGQTDDLYVKMNARGKALTSFENFKAELVDYIHKKTLVSANPDQADWKKLDKPEDGFGQKLDNAWTDIFWKLKSEDRTGICEFQYRIDEIFFAFFNRFFFNCQALEADSENWNKSPLYRNNDETLAFSSLKSYCIPPCIMDDRDCSRCESVNIPLKEFMNIQTVLDRWPKLATVLPGGPFLPPLGPSWDKNSFFFLPVYEKEKEKLSTIVDDNGNVVLKITNVTVKQRAVFFAVCQWLLHNEPSADCHDYSQAQKDHFQDWLRVIWNIVENSTPDLKDLLTFIHIFLLPGCHDILKYLANLSVTCDSGKYVVMSNAESQETNFETAAVQLKEECEKAVQIMGWRGNHGMIDGTWYYRIKEAEKYAFFHGGIRFLYQNADGIPNWSEFDVKYENAKKYFREDGLVEDMYPDANKVIISHCVDWESQLKRRYCFGKTAKNWKSILLESSFCYPVHHLMMDHKIKENVEIKTEWLKSVVELLIKDAIWSEMDSFSIDSYRLDWKCKVPCLWLSGYPGYTIRLVDPETEKIISIIRKVDATNTILMIRYFANKNYSFTLNGNEFTWDPRESTISDGTEEMSIDIFSQKYGITVVLEKKE